MEWGRNYAFIALVSSYSAGLVGLVVAGLVMNQPDESPFLRNPQGRDTCNQALTAQLRRTRLASGSRRHCGSSEEGPLPRLGGQGQLPRRNEVLCIFSSFFACFVIFLLLLLETKHSKYNDVATVEIRSPSLGLSWLLI